MVTVKSEKKKRRGKVPKPSPAAQTKKTVKKTVKGREKKPMKGKVVKKKVLRKKVKPMKVKEATRPWKEPMPIGGDKEEARKTLLEMREKLLGGTSENRIPQALTTQSDIGDLIDQAGDERDRELSLLLSVRDKEKLLAINEALEKLKEGTYGVCEECGDKIGPGRLKVMPLAKFCVSCQAKLEKEISVQRKAEEDLTYRGLTYPGGAEEEEG